MNRYEVFNGQKDSGGGNSSGSVSGGWTFESNDIEETTFTYRTKVEFDPSDFNAEIKQANSL